MNVFETCLVKIDEDTVRRCFASYLVDCRVALMKSTYSLVVVLIFCLVGCGTPRQSSLVLGMKAIETPSLKGDFAQTRSKADAAWAGRLDEAQLRKAIALYKQAVKMPTPQYDAAKRREVLGALYVRLSRAYYLLADSHLFLKLDAKSRDKPMMKVYEQGVTAAEKALALSAPTFVKRVNKTPSSWKKEVDHVPVKAIGALYWYGANLGKWAMLEGITTIMRRQEDILATMLMIQRKQPGFFHGAAHRYFGVYHTKVPVGGGDPAKSVSAFEKSIDLAPNYFATRVLYASHLATLKQEQSLFEKQLKYVINTPANVVDALTPENTLEQRKARRLLARTTKLFYQIPN